MVAITLVNDSFKFTQSVIQVVIFSLVAFIWCLDLTPLDRIGYSLKLAALLLFSIFVLYSIFTLIHRFYNSLLAKTIMNMKEMEASKLLYKERWNIFEALEQPILSVNENGSIVFTNERFISFMQDSCINPAMSSMVKRYEKLRSPQDKPCDAELLASKQVLNLKLFKEYSDSSKSGMNNNCSASNNSQATQEPVIYSIDQLLQKREKVLKSKIFVQSIGPQDDYQNVNDGRSVSFNNDISSGR